MDTELLIEVHQYYINSLKKQLSEEKKPLVESVLGTYGSVYISQTSCIHGNIKFYDSSDTEIRVTECKRTPGTSVGIPCATYDFPSEKNIRRIVITRPVCTDMLNSYVKIFDGRNMCTYESTPIEQSRSMRTVYTYTVPQPSPVTD